MQYKIFFPECRLYLTKYGRYDDRYQIFQGSVDEAMVLTSEEVESFGVLFPAISRWTYVPAN